MFELGNEMDVGSVEKRKTASRMSKTSTQAGGIEMLVDESSEMVLQENEILSEGTTWVVRAQAEEHRTTLGRF